MKKLMTLALGLAFVLGTVSVSFAQDTPKKEAPKKEKKKKAPKKKKDEAKKEVK